ncbi:MAG TPA: hypothetical protein V6C97_08065 [Oculatellaceae cyanobacterium]
MNNVVCRSIVHEFPYEESQTIVMNSSDAAEDSRTEENKRAPFAMPESDKPSPTHEHFIQQEEKSELKIKEHSEGSGVMLPAIVNEEVQRAALQALA